MCAGTLLWTQVFDLPLGAILRYCVSGKRRGASSLSVWRPLANLQRNSCSAALRAAPLFSPVIPRFTLGTVSSSRTVERRYKGFDSCGEFGKYRAGDF